MVFCQDLAQTKKLEWYGNVLVRGVAEDELLNLMGR